LEDRHVLCQEPLAQTPERPQEVPHPRPQSLQRVAVHLADPVAIGVNGPGALGSRVIDGPMNSAVALADAVLAVPLIGVHRRLPQARVVDHIVQLDHARCLKHVQANLP